MADVMVMQPSVGDHNQPPSDNSTTLTDTQRYLMAALIDPEQLRSHQPSDECGTPPDNIHSLVGRHHPDMLPRSGTTEVPFPLQRAPSMADPFAPPPPPYASSEAPPNFYGAGAGSGVYGGVTEEEARSATPPVTPAASSPERSPQHEDGVYPADPYASSRASTVVSVAAPTPSSYRGDDEEDEGYLYGTSAHTHAPRYPATRETQPQRQQPSMFANSLQEALYPHAEQPNVWATQHIVANTSGKHKKNKKKKKKKTAEEKARLRALTEKRIRTALLMNLDDLRESLPKNKRSELPAFNETSDPVDIELCLKRHARTQKQRETIEFMHTCVRGVVVLVALTNLATRGRMGVSKYGEMVEARLQDGSWNPMLVQIYKRYFRHASPSPIIVIGASLLGLLFYDIMNTKSGGRLETGIDGAKAAAKFLGVTSGEESTKTPEGGGVMDAIGGVVSAGKNFLTNTSGLGDSSESRTDSRPLPTPNPVTAGTVTGLRPPPE